MDILKTGSLGSLDIERIRGTKKGYRLRTGRWRILFALFSEEKRVEVVDIFTEKDKQDYTRRLRLFR